MATVPISGTSIRLMSGIPFNADYKNTRWFDNLSQQTSYFNSRQTVHTMSNASFQRIEGRHFIKVNKSIDDLWGTNYLTFLNKNKRFYAFVTNLEYINGGLTHVHFQIDVFQTWLFDMKFKPSYVVREHRPLWNSDGTPVINTIDEGLNYGTDYETMGSRQIRPDGYKWLVIVTKQPIGVNEDGENEDIKASVIGTPQPLNYYIVPYKDDDSVPHVELQDLDIGVLLTRPTKILEMIYQADSAVNNVVSIYVTDFIGLDYTISNDVVIFPKDGTKITPHIVVSGGDVEGQILEVNYVKKFTPKKVEVLSNKYELDLTRPIRSKESKLMMYPYTVLVLDDFKGNRQEFKLEYINQKELNLLWKGSLGTSNFNSISIENYNRGYEQDSFKRQTSNEEALISDQPNEVPVLADMLSAYLQGERNSIKNRQSQLQFNSMANLIGQGFSTVASTATGNHLGTTQGLTGMIQGAGNTVYELQGINAKIKDIDNVPAQLQKMGSNTAYNYGNDYNGLYIMIKQIKPEYRKILEDFFHMFGYKTNEVKVPNFHTRKHFNYVETKSCTITGNFNNVDLQELKNIFDNGITLWHTNDVGNYALGNGVI